MRQCAIFIGKELKEHIRSYRLLILGIVFILFGIMSPATAKFTPELLKMLTGDTAISNMLPPVTVTDSYLQFFKNMNSMGVIVLLLVFAGMVADEKVKGSAPLILTKNISRTAFVLAKFAGAALLWTILFTSGALVCQGYTLWLFPGSYAANLLPAFGAYWLYGLLLMAFTTLASTAARSHGMAALGAFAGWGLLMISMIPAKIGKVSPAALGSLNLQLIQGTTTMGEMLIPVLLAVGMIGLALGCASWSMSRQEL